MFDDVAKFLYIPVDFLSSFSIHFWDWSYEISNYNFVFVYSYFQFYQLLLHILQLYYLVHTHLGLLSFLSGSILYHCIMSLIIFFVLKFTLCGFNIDSPAFFWSGFAWHIFFHSFTFNLPIFLQLMWVCYWHHMVQPHILIHSGNLSLN